MTKKSKGGVSARFEQVRGLHPIAALRITNETNPCTQIDPNQLSNMSSHSSRNRGLDRP